MGDEVCNAHLAEAKARWGKNASVIDYREEGGGGPCEYCAEEGKDESGANPIAWRVTFPGLGDASKRALTRRGKAFNARKVLEKT